MNLLQSHTRKSHRDNMIPRNVSFAPEDRRLCHVPSLMGAAGYHHTTSTSTKNSTTAPRRHDHNVGPHMMLPTRQSALYRNQDDQGSQRRTREELADALQDISDCLERMTRTS